MSKYEFKATVKNDILECTLMQPKYIILKKRNSYILKKSLTMKKIYFAISLVLLLFFIGCIKDLQTTGGNSQFASIKATIGTISFNSNKNNVNVQMSPPQQGGTVGGQSQVTLTGESDISTGTDKDYLVIAFGYNPGDIKKYSIEKKEAICAYHKSGSSDDITLQGTVTILKNSISGNGKYYLYGTFDFTTQKGVHVNTGTFTVYVN
jgi:hypothetical protein